MSKGRGLFLILHESDGSEIVVNVDNITRIKKHGGGSVIFMNDGADLYVREDLLHIKRTISEGIPEDADKDSERPGGETSGI